MKKICLLLLVFVLFFSSFGINAQDKMSYQDHKLFGAGISLGYIGPSYGVRSMAIPPLSAYYEMGVHDYITAGPYLGFARWSYVGSFANERYSTTFINVGARGSFHLTGFINEILELELDEEKIDWYFSLFVGMRFTRYPSTWGQSTTPVGFHLGPITGVRYYISDNLAIFAEGGYGALGALTFGVSLKL